MNRTILSHDIKAGIARVRFEHEDVTIEDDYDLKKVVPGAAASFEAMGIPFDEENQLRALEFLTKNIEGNIDSGDIKPTPVSTTPDYVAPPEPEDAPATKKKSS